MKKIIYIIVLLFGGVTSSSAQNIHYSYDANGQRITRQVILMSQLDLLDGNGNNLSMNKANNATKTNQSSNSDQKDDPSRENNNKDNFEEIINNTSITIYPNPTVGNFQIAFSDLSEMNQGMIILYDANGRQLQKQQIMSTVEQMDISNAANGEYILLVNINGSIKEWKIIKM